MNITPIYKLSFILISLINLIGVTAQTKYYKVKEDFKLSGKKVLNLNANHAEIIFEKGSGNTVKLEAYVEGDFPSKEIADQYLDRWQIEVSSSEAGVIINATNRNFQTLQSTDKNAAAISHIDPIIRDMLAPILRNIENNPMPKALSENMVSMSKANNRVATEQEQKYVEEWAAQIQEKFGEDKELSNKILQQLNLSPVISENSEVKLPNWQGDQFAQQMQNWASSFSGEVQIYEQNGNNIRLYRYRTNNNTNTKAPLVKRILKVKVPERIFLKLNVRHGNVQLTDEVENLVALLSHTSFTAEKVKGSKSIIKSSFSPISVKEWIEGRLVINYVKNCRIQKASNLRVNADSSNLYIQELDNGAISGSFGMITVAQLSEDFTSLDLAVENSDFKLKLPKAAFNITYSGMQSRIALPKTLQTKARRNFNNVFVNGYQNTRNTDKIITINAKYSDIVLQ